MRWILIVSALGLWACESGGAAPISSLDGGNDADSDSDTDGDTDGDTDTSTEDCPEGWCGDVCCEDDEICHEGVCIPDQGDCVDNQECQEDSYCDEGTCVPWGLGEFDTDCTQVSIAGLFQPGIQCEFTAPPPSDPYPDHVRVLSTPMVVDFDFDDDPSTISPSIIVMTYNGDDGSSGFYLGSHGVIRVLDGSTCSLQYNVGSQLNGCNSPAIADLDLDGRAEIIAHTGYGGVIAYRYNDTLDTFEVHCQGSLSFAAQSSGWSAPSVFDLDDDGSPEIMTGGITYDADCNLLDDGLGLTGHMYSGAGYPVVGDLDGELDTLGNPSVELATGAELYRFDTTSQSWQEVWSGGTMGYIAIADFGTYGADPTLDDRMTLDGIAEIVVVTAPTVRITTMDGRVIFGPVNMPSGQGGGPPTVGDFDGDGLAEVSCSGSDSIAVFDPDCTGLPDMVFCGSLNTNGILWWQPSQDHSSNRTGSSLFDFEGDGRVEVIYADEVFSRVYDGQSGEVVFSQYHSSCTWNENPIVADVDGDFNAELIVPSNENCTISPTTMGALTYPTSPWGNPMDPLFKGLRCDSNADCISGNCDTSYCRCTSDADCGGTGTGFVCAPPPAATPGTGDTCRAEWLGAYNGIRVYSDVADRWVGSRTIWSQHAYSVTHIEEDGTVFPTSSWDQNWLVGDMNHFRQNVQGDATPFSSPDMTARDGQFTCNSEGHAILQVEVCNRGTQSVGAGVPVAFYESAALVCLSETTAIIPPGECEILNCTWGSPPISAVNAVDVTAVADDDGTGSGENTECVEGNNSAVIPDVFCIPGPE